MNSSRWKEIKAIFELVLDAPADSREELLREQCRDDNGLKNEVESLLRSYAHSGEFLEPPSSEHPAVHHFSRTADQTTGKHFGPYRIERLIGHGGMGDVYEAVRDDGQFQKRVAVKLVRHASLSSDLVARFHQERQTLARLEHPHIARLLDGGTTPDGLPYLVMEYVDGIQLDRFCDTNKLSVAARLDLFRKVCGAVHYAHQNLVVHRDLKPGNILVTPDGVPKLLDFGVAKFLDNTQQSLPLDVTRVGLRFITLEYASPEQVKGEAVTTASDVYSLGVLLYRLLTGRSPYDFKTRLPHEMTRVVCEEQPPKPSTTSKHRAPEAFPDISKDKLRRLLAGDLDNIILKALQKDPSRRYSSVEQFAEDIRRHREGLPVLARPDTVAYRTAKFVKRNTIGVVATAVVVLAVAGGVFATLWQANKATREAAKVEQINQFLQEMLSSADPAKSGKDVTVVQALDRAVERADRELVLEPEIAASVLHTIGETYLALGQYEKAERDLRRSITMREQTFGDEHEDVATGLASLAFLQQLKGDHGTSDSLYQLAIAMHKRTSEPDGHLGSMLGDYGSLLREEHKTEKALEVLRESIEVTRMTAGKESREFGIVLANLGSALQDVNQLSAADSAFREGLAILKRTLGEEHIDVAQISNNFAFVLMNEGKGDEAMMLFRESLAIRKKVLGNDHPEVALALANLSGFELNRQNIDEAERLARESLKLFRATVSPDNLRLSTSLMVLGRIANLRGDPVNAQNYLEEVLRIRRKNLRPGHFGIVGVEVEIGRALTLQKRLLEAESVLTEAYTSLKASVGEDHQVTVATVKYLGELYRDWGKPEQARAYEAKLRLLR